MNRRDFLTTTAAASGALLLPFPALADPPMWSKVFHVHTMPSGWTSGPYQDHYSEDAVVRIAEMTWQKLEKNGRLIVLDNYHRDKPLGWLTHLELNQTRDIEKVRDRSGQVVELIPGKATAYLVATIRSDLDLSGKFCGPGIYMAGDVDPLHVTGENIQDVKDWSMFDQTKFVGLLGARRVA